MNPKFQTGAKVEKDGKIVAKNKVMETIKHRKNYQSDFKAKVALEAARLD